jgi:hypothetical protein
MRAPGPVSRLCLALVLFLAIAAKGLCGELWFEDSNLGVAGGLPGDFKEKFVNPESWAEARKHIAVYMVRTNVLFDGRHGISEEFLRDHFFPVLAASRIRFALDAGGATWMTQPGRARLLPRELELVRRIERLGGKVCCISLQSVLSKPLPANARALDYPMAQRVADVVAYAQAVHALDPSIAIGLIDALPSHGEDYRGPYLALKQALEQRGLKLAYIHLDTTYELIRDRRQGMSWQTVAEVERFVRGPVDARFGLFFTSRQGGVASARAFHVNVVGMLEESLSQRLAPDSYILASWFPHPSSSIPENAGGFDFPAMRTTLQFGRRLEQLQSGRLREAR